MSAAVLAPAAPYQELRWDAGPDGDLVPPPLSRDAPTLYLHLCNYKGHRMLPAAAHPQFGGYWCMACAACRRDVAVRVVPGRTDPLDLLGSAHRHWCAGTEKHS